MTNGNTNPAFSDIPGFTTSVDKRISAGSGNLERARSSGFDKELRFTGGSFEPIIRVTAGVAPGTQGSVTVQDPFGRLFGGRRLRFNDRSQAQREVATELNRINLIELANPGTFSSTPGSGVGGSGGTTQDEGSNEGLRGQEGRTPEQLRIEAELAKQLGVERLSDVKPPDAPEQTLFEKPALVAGQDEFLTATESLLGETPEAALATAAPAQQVAQAPRLAAPQGTAATVAGQEAQATGVTQAAPTRVIDPDAIEGVVTEQSLAAAQTEELDQRATVSFQLEQLFTGQGNFTTLFARPIQEATNRMLARGLGSSSMAAAAIIQSTIESGIPIAREDANKFATIQLQNLSNKQATALANASVFAAMDLANVEVRLQSQIQNAQNFLAIDVKNLDNLQQAEVLNQAATNQALLSDQAAENAIEQLNVATEAETDRFFSQLGVTVDTANADRINAVEQFNAGQTNTIEVFNAKQKDLRERFNSELQIEVAASNAQHRRRITLTDNANQMLVNEFNARQANDISVREYNQQYLNYRDAATRIFSSSESNENRAVQLATAELSASATRAAASAGGGGGSSSILPSLISAGGSIVAAVF